MDNDDFDLYDPTQCQDDLLASMVDHTNDTGQESGVTLTIGGMLVTGRLISRDRFLELNSTSTEQRERFRKRYGLAALREELGEDWTERLVHLADVRFFAGSWAPDLQDPGMPTWRGRLSEVQGWAPGVFVPKEYPDTP